MKDSWTPNAQQVGGNVSEKYTHEFFCVIQTIATANDPESKATLRGEKTRQRLRELTRHKTCAGKLELFEVCTKLALSNAEIT